MVVRTNPDHFGFVPPSYPLRSLAAHTRLKKGAGTAFERTWYGEDPCFEPGKALFWSCPARPYETPARALHGDGTSMVE